MVIVEALKNLCGVSIVRNYSDYMDFNIRKFQSAQSVPAESAAIPPKAEIKEVSTNIMVDGEVVNEDDGDDKGKSESLSIDD